MGVAGMAVVAEAAALNHLLPICLNSAAARSPPSAPNDLALARFPAKVGRRLLSIESGLYFPALSQPAAGPPCVGEYLNRKGE